LAIDPNSRPPKLQAQLVKYLGWRFEDLFEDRS
jgi:hypothetical protein